MEAKRSLGLNIRKKEEPKLCSRSKVASVFGDDDDDNDMPVTAINAASASVIRVQKAAEREYQKAEAEDPTIFDYDGSYDEIQAINNQKKEEARKADRKRESKYAENIIKAHARRQLEQFSREERQQIKEREKEGDEFADKEVFVTGAYRKQQEEVKKYREQEAEEAAFNDMTSVQKQKMWEIGMGRTLLNDLARDPTAFKKKKEQKNVRKRADDSDEEKDNNVTEKKAEKSAENSEAPSKKHGKSIYSDDEPEEDYAAKPPKKNFEGDLKPGLNTVKKAATHAERIRQRNFTPSPQSSDDEQVGQVRRRTSSPSSRKSRDSKETESKNSREDDDVPQKTQKMSLKEKLKPKKIDKLARLSGLKAILKQRNTEKDIEAARQRYFERKEQGVVVPPL